jgi:hypothetical protein
VRENFDPSEVWPETVRLNVAPVIEFPYMGRLKWVNVPRLNVVPAEKGPERPEFWNK